MRSIHQGTWGRICSSFGTAVITAQTATTASIISHSEALLSTLHCHRGTQPAMLRPGAAKPGVRKCRTGKLAIVVSDLATTGSTSFAM
jgi:hypothetical protein